MDKFEKVRGDDPSEGKASTAQDEVKNMRRLTTNNLAIAALYYSSVENKWKQGMLKEVCEPVTVWHTEQNRRLRSVGECKAWTLEQAKGGWLTHIIGIFKKLADYDALTEAGLTRDLATGWLKKGCHVGDVGMYHDHAASYCRLVSSLVFYRIRPFVLFMFKNHIKHALSGSC